MKKDKYIIIAAALVFAVIFGFAVVKPSILGYTTYQDIKETGYSIDEYGKSLEELGTKLATCEESGKTLEAETSEKSDQLSECEKTSTTCIAEKQSCDKLIASQKEYLQEKNDEVREVELKVDEEKAKYDAFARNTANNICCKAKVDNNNIKYYKVENNKVKCLEEGELEIECYGS